MSTDEPAHPVISERKTTELCGHVATHGIRCVRPKGHDGEHESLRAIGTPVRWK